MAGEGPWQPGVVEQLLKGVPVAIMAKQLAAIGAEGEEGGEVAELILAMAAPALLAGSKKGEEGEKQGEGNGGPGGGEGLVSGAPGEGREGGDDVGRCGAEVGKGEADRQQKGQQGEIAAAGTGEGAGEAEGGKDCRDGTPAAEGLTWDHARGAKSCDRLCQCLAVEQPGF
jgi:hypothetical protein